MDEPTPKKPRIVIEISEALVTAIHGDIELDVEILDHDWFEECYLNDVHDPTCTEHTEDDVENYRRKARLTNTLPFTS